MLYVQSYRLLMMDGKTVRNMQSATTKQNKFEKLVHILGFTIEIYHDARPYKCQIKQGVRPLFTKEVPYTLCDKSQNL